MKRHINTTKNMSAAITAMVDNPPMANGNRSSSRRQVAVVTGDVEVWIDVDILLAFYGPRALKSKGRKASVAKGGVQLRAINVKREDV